MLNRLILSVKTAGLNHKQIKQVLIGDESEGQNLQYPLMRVWYAGNEFSGNSNTYKIAVAIADRHQDNSISEIDAMSDCDAILIDILSSLKYIYRSDNVTWDVQDSIEPFYDSTPDIVAGGIVNIRAKVPYNRDFCQVPSNDFDFPAVGLFAVSIIDEGFSNSTYTSSNIVN